MPCCRFNPMRCFPGGRRGGDPAARSKSGRPAVESLWPGAAGWTVGCRVGLLMAFWAGVCDTGLPVQAQSSPESTPEHASDLEFVSDIRPILERHCYACHAGEQSSSGLRLDVRQAAFAGGDLYGPSIVAGRSDESPLVQVVRDEEADLRMPPDGERLAPAEIARLVDWIDRGAEWPAAVDQSSLTDPSEHWSFRPLRRPALPISHRRDWLRSPIDNFVLDALEAAELGPAPEVSRAGWLRRVTLDLIGLPPTPEELERFLTDPTEDAYGRVVDRLLASPHHAERWAQHWFDVVRYADTHGFEVNTERPNAWPYRDYVIDALNRDVPYDQFVREQLHGDLLGEDAATGFLVTASVLLPGQIGQDEPSKRLARQDALDEIVVNIGQTFLGLSLGCARCHYHKFDPISQRDYFAIQALVAGVEYEERVLQQPEGDPLSERPDSSQRQLLRDYAEATVPYREALAGGMPVFAGRFRTPDPIRLLRRGDPEQPGGLVEPAVPSALGDERLGVDSTDAERRRMLASWISRSDNPLTARVIVNRLWQWHFGTGLVETANDFGRHGTLPSHPELLDWLAAELIESGWSLRHLHRMIVLSSTYRQSTAMNSEAQAVDGDNRLLWRYPLRRLEGEAIRDALLASSGQLNRLRGGPGFDLFDRRGGLSGFEPIEDVTPAGARRMVYAHRVRRERDAVFGAFDCPDGGQSVDRRRQSTTPIQALNLMNSGWVLQVVEALAERLQQAWPEAPESQIDSAYRTILSRPPGEDELQDALPVVRRLGVAPLIRALFNSSEFVYLP
jgi:hypothetical protein